MVDRFDFEGSYQSVKRLARKLLGGSIVEARVSITIDPGQEGQVDYGTGEMPDVPRCASARSLGARIARVWCCASRHDAAAVGFDDARIDEEIALPLAER